MFLGDKELKFKIQISPNDVKYKVKSMLPHIVNGKVVSVRFWSRKNTTEEEVVNICVLLFFDKLLMLH